MGGSLGKSDSVSSSNNAFDSTSFDNKNIYDRKNIGSYNINDILNSTWQNDMSRQAANKRMDTNIGATQDVWGPQGAALGGMYNQAGDLAQKGGAGAASQMKGGQDFSQGSMGAAVQPWMQQMQGGAYSDLGIGDQLMNSLQQSQNAPSAMQEINSMIMGGSGNNYADAMRDQYTQDATRAQDNMLRNMDARAAASGMSGGSRHGTAIGQGMEDINRNLQRNMANVGYNTFDKDLDRKLAIAQQADANTMGRQQLMSNMLQNQQGTANKGISGAGDMIGYGQNQQMMPWQGAQSYANILGGPTVLSDSYDLSRARDSSNAYTTGIGGSNMQDLSRSGASDTSKSRDTSKSGSRASGTGSGASSAKGFGLSGGK